MATEDFGRDPDRQVPVTTGERAGELAEAATLLCVGLMVGRRLERLGQLVDQRFGARPLADQLPGLAGDAVNRPLTHPPPAYSAISPTNSGCSAVRARTTSSSFRPASVAISLTLTHSGALASTSPTAASSTG